MRNSTLAGSPSPLLGFQKTTAPNSEQDLEGILEGGPEPSGGDSAEAGARRGPGSKAFPRSHSEDAPGLPIILSTD